MNLQDLEDLQDALNGDETTPEELPYLQIKILTEIAVQLKRLADTAEEWGE